MECILETEARGGGLEEIIPLVSGERVLKAWETGDVNAAIDGALRQVGRPVLTSAAALAIGFLVLAFVPWKSLASFGLVSVVAISASLLADLLVLPALLRLGRGTR